MHEADEIAPVDTRYRPAAQVEQSISSSCRAALVAVSAKYAPAGHVMQVTDEAAPVATENLPTAQIVQSDIWSCKATLLAASTK